MPNPLIGGRINTSKRPVRPEPEEPVMETYAGNNNPWRGTQDHGVTPQFDPADPDTYTVDVNGRPVPIKYEPEEVEPDPIPVRVVQQYSKEYRRWQSDRITVRKNTEMPTGIVGKDDTRTRILVINTTADKTVYLANDAADLLLRGYPLLPGKEWSSFTEEDVWATSADNTDVIVGVSIEKVVPERVKHAK